MKRYWVVLAKYNIHDFHNQESNYIIESLWNTINLDEKVEGHANLEIHLDSNTGIVNAGFILYCEKSLARRITTRLSRYVYFQDYREKQIIDTEYGLSKVNANEIMLIDLLSYLKFESLQYYHSGKVEIEFIWRNFDFIIEKVIPEFELNRADRDSQEDEPF
ncbi:hypothetical protein [Deinococcus radiodurans]|nr:hypothetical protein [Deinococcus radiodurans]QIP28824.1 hypothetical protein HAV23_06245 [Deinococcus radiodurans]QIP32471.1 hypothetical protein HAV35_10545 [Deinococcus radiodurans]UTA50229.1 hypothetical protein MSS93_10775 [Deinococcus radiodurans]